jgi:glycosyltransferase involved in cell wall biosynthesis
MSPTPPSPPARSGAPEVLIAILTDLSTDHRCWKWAVSLRDAGYRPVIYCDRPLHPLGDAWADFDVRVITRASHLRGFFPVFFRYLLRLLPVLLTTRARVWVAMDAPPLFWLSFWGRLRGRKVTYDAHELFLETPMVRARASRRLFWKLWEDGGLALAKRCVTVSPGILAKLEARHPKVRFHLLPNMPSGELEAIAPLGARPSEGDPSGTTASPVRIVYQGGLRKASGLPELIAALGSRPGIVLDIYGGGGEEGALREAARAAGIADRVRLHGVVPFEKLQDLMAGAHAGIHLVQPTCESFALTLSNKIFDYTRAGVPVLFSDNPAHRLLLREFPVGVVADAYSPEAVGAALDRLLADRETYAEACRAARARWRWENFFRGVPALLEAP